MSSSISARLEAVEAARFYERLPVVSDDIIRTVWILWHHDATRAARALVLGHPVPEEYEQLVAWCREGACAWAAEQTHTSHSTALAELDAALKSMDNQASMDVRGRPWTRR